MNVSLTSGASSASSLWSLLASRASASAKSADTSTSYSDSSTTEGAASAQRPDGPPPPPAQFDCAMSTEQFAGMAGMMGPPPGGDPIASLDADDDGSVSAEEFGLEGASEEVQNLFAAMDEDGSGELSTDEIDAFREQMMASGGRPPQPPAMGAGDASSFVQQLAERYASLASTDDSESESAFSVTA